MNPQSLQQKILILLQPKHSSQREKISYICGLRARIECEPVSEYSTRSDRVTNIGYLLSFGASPLPTANQIYLSQQVFLSSSVMARITLQGFPTATELSGISLITTLPPPMTTLLPIVTPGIT